MVSMLTERDGILDALTGSKPRSGSEFMYVTGFKRGTYARVANDNDLSEEVVKRTCERPMVKLRDRGSGGKFGGKRGFSTVDIATGVIGMLELAEDGAKKLSFTDEKKEAIDAIGYAIDTLEEIREKGIARVTPTYKSIKNKNKADTKTIEKYKGKAGQGNNLPHNPSYQRKLDADLADD